MTVNMSNKSKLAKRIILVRHGESTANVDREIYIKIPSHRIPLSEKGIEQAGEAGRKLVDVISEHGESQSWQAYFYVSPSQRTWSTLREIGLAFPGSCVAGVREECRIREVNIGMNMMSKNVEDLKKKREQERRKYGKFFYRFPGGESGADVYDRVSGFIESFWRDTDMTKHTNNNGCECADDELNVVIVSHGSAILVFLMSFFRWSIEQYESLICPKNCEIIVMELGSSGEYSLAIHHDDQTLQKWGLSPEMIEDQKQRAKSEENVHEQERNPWYFNTFFEFVDSDYPSGIKKMVKTSEC